MRFLISVVLAEGWQASRSNTVLLLWSTTVTSTPEKVHNLAKLQSEMEIPKWEKWDLWKEHDQFPFGQTGMVHWWEHFWPGFEQWHQHHNSVGWVCYVLMSVPKGFSLDTCVLESGKWLKLVGDKVLESHTLKFLSASISFIPS